jgi:hypothetical protein
MCYTNLVCLIFRIFVIVRTLIRLLMFSFVRNFALHFTKNHISNQKRGQNTTLQEMKKEKKHGNIHIICGF